MKRMPSVNTLEAAFPGKGKVLRRLLTSESAVRDHPAAIALERQSHNPQPLHMLRLTALDAEAGTFGVEYIPRGHNARSPAFDYLNAGDTYATTIVRFTDGRYAVTCWGDIVERGHYD